MLPGEMSPLLLHKSPIPSKSQVSISLLRFFLSARFTNPFTSWPPPRTYALPRPLVRTRGALHPPSGMIFLSLPSLSPASHRSSTSKWRASLSANISLVCPFLRAFKRTLQYSFRQIVSVALLGNRLWTWTLPPPPQRTATGSPCGPTLHLRTGTLSAASTSPLSPAAATRLHLLEDPQSRP